MAGAFRVKLVKIGRVESGLLYGLCIEGDADKDPIDLIKRQFDALVDQEGWQDRLVSYFTNEEGLKRFCFKWRASQGLFDKKFISHYHCFAHMKDEALIIPMATAAE